ncbi:hypothetical protein BegalDRAFT_3037 [Beggiatoa alba B18LD]|uniref:Putative restriction endonuclease domain-containing protein n=1 Tax=Beggiatoa alba B18LD TaxID=395493 RepID=I3CJS0_9GAMM|nr:Uma2 family endonuclease [Beggiatoa alba]EIJ43863.1 hypothetical protein BegalDRAFT_3037 [Beggiatoa alba B18LD]
MQLDLQQLIIPAGQHVLLNNIDWASFEAILQELGEHRASRLTYHQGVLEIMTPLLQHESAKELIGDFVKILLEEQNYDFNSVGSTTFKSVTMKYGIEPDQCFYIEHEPQIRGKDRLDLKIDPPPDLAIEIDITSETWISTYEALAVPELWRYDGHELHIYVLQEGHYVQTEQSLHFPQFPVVQAIPDYLQQTKVAGRNKVMRAFRAWVRGFL